MTNISWTEESWNPVTGCSRISEGCRNCYAVPNAWRMSRHPDPKIHIPYSGTTAKRDSGHIEWTGRINCLPERLQEPRHWKKPRRIFVNSMSDLFHERVPDAFIADVFIVMTETPRHTFQILTKRAERLAEWPGPWAPNVWAGVSIEDRRNLARLDHLRRCEAITRWVSLEPLLEDLGDINLDGVHWVVVGGESGPQRRPFDQAWARSIRDQCKRRGIAFYFKQDSDIRPQMRPHLVEPDGSQWTWHQYPGDLCQPIEAV